MIFLHVPGPYRHKCGRMEAGFPMAAFLGTMRCRMDIYAQGRMFWKAPDREIQDQ